MANFKNFSKDVSSLLKPIFDVSITMLAKVLSFNIFFNLLKDHC